ncbi:SDR family oxidoreductase [Nonomuraea cavernae]|uniref:Short-chain dehydrogenase n=1 Tax=Nonomuraea cavernae TaxID=2045107 RepID=A0A917ZBP6_9ACTN|nr:SDR family oxidoreductase [Nonomuraea cavernae]MCA2188854.1 SDR family oxidoreductase [Nonomuraea cavernae]GGO78442.1 short-chain dehydrogenase [Nonomuraea cavernae]
MVIVVTGGTRGIGHGLVGRFLETGHEVAFCGSRTESVEKAALDGALGVVADVGDREQVRGLWDAAVERFGRVDIWINNAGISHARRPLWELPEAEAAEVVRVNLTGVINGCAVALAGMAAQGHGHVWNMEGLGSDGRAVPGLAVYGSTKRALHYLTRALAKEVPDGVSVGLLSPGMVVTDLLLHDEISPESRRIFDILADRVETVTPWLADQAVRRVGNGAHVRWLTGGKILTRFATAPFTKRKVLP